MSGTHVSHASSSRQPGVPGATEMPHVSGSKYATSSGTHASHASTLRVPPAAGTHVGRTSSLRVPPGAGTHVGRTSSLRHQAVSTHDFAAKPSKHDVTLRAPISALNDVTEEVPRSSAFHERTKGHTTVVRSQSTHHTSKPTENVGKEMAPYAPSSTKHVVNTASHAATMRGPSGTAAPPKGVRFDPQSTQITGTHTQGGQITRTTRNGTTQGGAQTQGGQTSRFTQQGTQAKGGATMTNLVKQGNVHDEDIVALAKRIEQLEAEKEEAKKTKADEKIDRLQKQIDLLQLRDAAPRYVYRPYPYYW